MRTRATLALATAAWLTFAAGMVLAADPTVVGLPGPSAEASEDPGTWPCRLEGWEPGDHWGPGPDDVVPDVPVCEPEPEVPGPSSEPLPSEEALVTEASSAPAPVIPEGPEASPWATLPDTSTN